MPALESPLIVALNHLLDSERWAAERLAPFAGATIEIRAAPMPTLRLALVDGGRVAEAPAGGEPSLVISVRPEALAALTRGTDHLMREIDVSGNERLASEVLLLARHLRWDFEEDLARFVGDIAAHRIAAAARSLAAWGVDAGRRLVESLVEYAVEERRLLIVRAEFADHAAACARLRDSLERLEKRLDRLRNSRAGSPAGFSVST